VEFSLLIGPVFTREAVVSPRRVRHYIMRSVYGLALLLLICTAWMILNGTQVIQNVGDMARFGSILFQILAPLQLALILFLAAMSAASNIAIEKDRQTLILLLMSRLSNSELVLGKLFASLLSIGVMLLTSLPIFMLIVLFGGTSFSQVGWTFAVTAATAFATGSLGAVMALWREKTFQTLALVGIAILFWIGLWEAVALSPLELWGVSAAQLAGSASPLRAILAASGPSVSRNWAGSVLPFLIVAVSAGGLLCLIGIWKVRRWNPHRETRSGSEEEEAELEQQVDLFGKLANDPTGVAIVERVLGNESPDDTDGVEVEGHDSREADPMAGAGASQPRVSAGASTSQKAGSGASRGMHVDDRSRVANLSSREVWDNPVLWREMCTWAYGKKIIFIRAVYWLLAACIFLAIYSLVASGAATRTTTDSGVSVPVAAKPLAPFVLLSMVLVNALAVTSITTERDGRALDLLRVTDISPSEFLFGKLLGVLFVALDMVLLPLAMCVYLWFHEVVSGENLLYLIVGILTLYIFVTMLGVHTGMSYAGSRQAIAVSLGTVFFLFLGVVTSMVLMISFAGNVEAQLTPFLACIVGGAIGLYVAMGWNVPSPALALASAILPFTMFYSITSLLLGNYLAVLLVVCFAYGFATAAMMIPRLSEFLVSSDRSTFAENG
jgi:ABC-type transport system involved in multi-copper enzyme maturation permease subunit